MRINAKRPVKGVFDIVLVEESVRPINSEKNYKRLWVLFYLQYLLTPALIQ